MRSIQLIIITIVIAGCVSCNSKKDYFSSFPAGSTPEEIGARLSRRFVPGKHMYYGKWIHYAEVFTWYGALRYAQAVGDRQLIQQLQDRFEPLFTTEQHLLPPWNHTDFNLFGCLPLEFYKINKDKRYYDLGMVCADTQWELPENATEAQKALADKGLTWQSRLWVDDAYVINIIQMQAWLVTGNRKYIDRSAHEMVYYLDNLQRPNGLFYHGPDVPFFWGRGNGWMAAGLADLLRTLPNDNPDRPRIMQGYLKMMESLKSFQTEKGMWNQLIDEPDCWAETSGTAMFTYAMIIGVKHGWLKTSDYGPVARKAWLALVTYINDDGDVTEVCEGTVKTNDRQFYFDRPRITGDYHGQAPMLWCVAALLEK